MINIDKLTEAQLRFIVRCIADVSDDVWLAMQEDDYPQQTNNEGSDND